MDLNKSASPETTLSAEANVSEGQFSVEEWVLNTEKSLKCRAGTWRPTVLKKERIYNQDKLAWGTVHHGDVSSYVRHALLTNTSHKHGCNGMGKETIKAIK